MSRDSVLNCLERLTAVERVLRGAASAAGSGGPAGRIRPARPPDGRGRPGRSGPGTTPAEATQRVIDQEVGGLLREAERRALDVLGEHRSALDRLADLLLERETVDGTDVDEILGRVPGRRQPVGATGHHQSKQEVV